MLDFLRDTLEDSGILQVRLTAKDLIELISVRSRLGLDFDDAYQYFAASKMNCDLVSFDKDFDHTERGRKTPTEIS